MLTRIRKTTDLLGSLPGSPGAFITRPVRLLPEGDVHDDGDQGDDVDEDVDEDAGDGDSGEDGDEDKPLGPAGTKALQAEKDKRRAAQAELRKFKSLGLTPEQIRELTKGGKQTSGDDEAPDAEAIRAQVRAEVDAEVARDRATDKIEARAAGKFADAEDAVAILLRTNDINDFLDNGKPDVEAIDEALDELLEKKPHLAAAAQGGGKRFKGGADGGARKGQKSQPKSLQDAITARITG